MAKNEMTIYKNDMKLVLIINGDRRIEDQGVVEAILKTADRLEKNPLEYWSKQESVREDGRLCIFFMEQGAVELYPANRVSKLKGMV